MSMNDSSAEGSAPLPRRIQRQRTRGWRMPPNTVVVSRPSRWGNPWKISQGAWWFVDGPGTPIGGLRCGNEEGARLVAVNNFRRWAKGEAGRARLQLEQLSGKNLACWCPIIDQHGKAIPCHADVLLELANASPATKKASA